MVAPPTRAGEPGYGGLSRVVLRYERGPGTDIYGVDGQVDTGVRFLGGREFIAAGLTQVTSDRVNSRLMIDVGSGLIWPQRIAPYLSLGVMGSVLNASNDSGTTATAASNSHTDAAAAWGGIGVRLRLSRSLSLKLSRRRYEFFRSGASDVLFSVTGLSLLFAYR